MLSERPSFLNDVLHHDREHRFFIHFAIRSYAFPTVPWLLIVPFRTLRDEWCQDPHFSVRLYPRKALQRGMGHPG